MLVRLRTVLFALCAAAVALCLSPTRAQQRSSAPGPAAAHKALLDRYCVGCHNDQLKTGGLSLQNADLNDVPKAAETWEKVIRKLRVGAMPPQNMPRPDSAALDALASYLETSIDQAAAANPNPGRVSIHRLNRAEYGNAVRDLLGLEIDAAALLPADDEAAGFDNMADVLRMSPALMERYLSASWNVSRLALGNMAITPATTVYRVRPDLSQDQHIDGLPLGTRGGISENHLFPLDGEYIIKVRLWRNTFDLMRGMEDPHQIEISLDGEPIKTITAGGREDFVRMAENPGSFGADIDQRLTVRVPVKAGVHTVAAYVILRSHALREHLIKPFLRTTIDGLDVTGDPSIDRLSIEGPFAQTGPGETASRQKILSCRPANAEEELPCARSILGAVARRAYRRPITGDDMESLLSFFQRGRNRGGSFEAGIESALQLILASPEFLVRFEPDPDDVEPGAAYRIGDLALASRLSFFLWSTFPDDELLDTAAMGRLRDPGVLRAQTLRMLRDPRSSALTDNFAEQWLFLRNVKSSQPDLVAFPDFDDNLRQSMRQETKLFFESILRENRSAMDLLNADYTFVNERLARHYGIPGVYGSQFRRIQVADENRRGLLGHASILTVTSYPNRTSPVQRGKWILTNILGVPPLPPPPDVPELKENQAGARPRSLRERMELHRTVSGVCAGCHQVMDPFGFALENFDGIGRWRTRDDGNVIDPSGKLFEGSVVDGPAGLRRMLSKRPEVFVGVMTEKMLTYALGRSLEYYDMPAVRKIVRSAAPDGYRMQDLVIGIVESVPFQMKIKREVAGGQYQ
jgi:mono/diheme cytochrome c family protein